MGHTQEYFKKLFDHPMRGVNSVFMREIMYDHNRNLFIDLEAWDDVEYISNVYEHIDPLYIELFKTKFEDMIIKDKTGRLTLLTMMPYVD